MHQIITIVYDVRNCIILLSNRLQFTNIGKFGVLKNFLFKTYIT